MFEAISIAEDAAAEPPEMLTRTVSVLYHRWSQSNAWRVSVWLSPRLPSEPRPETTSVMYFGFQPLPSHFRDSTFDSFTCTG